ncbi:hypothetical protein P171DRAFT_472004 [Karstenula rhodostoma CBS 690.94]|uniref:Uncharacterized protein n=1 Tax=Karstenula rhodostoma CBS 690.94 TaxID=1392251 RepID=A0A9P4PM59_9PLEO|nr:hypothetical protein P171DRAFT_472004 [Karstenula rhodostoma CBS 690.94]
MSAVKRPAASLDPAEPSSKRARPMPPTHRRPAQVSGQRPVQSSAIHEVIYISSTSPDGTEDVRPPPHMKPSGGIAPEDSLQDEPVNSIECAPRGRNKRTGLDHYLYIAGFKAKDYVAVTADFDAYRYAAPPNAPPGDPLPDIPPQTLDLGPTEPQYDYQELPVHEANYAQPIYKATTWNPLIALAIIRLAEKNLAFMNFNSDLAHLPNVGPQTLPPEFPPVDDGEPMPYLDDATTWPQLPGDQQITVAFLPEYYLDGRHALAFWTRKVPSGRLCSIVCAPCTTPELRAAGLACLAPVDAGVFESRSHDGVPAEQMEWNKFRIGVGGGEWLYPCLERDIITWERVEDVVGREWVVRVKVSLTVNGIEESSPEAQTRDAGFWHETRWE